MRVILVLFIFLSSKLFSQDSLFFEIVDYRKNALLTSHGQEFASIRDTLKVSLKKKITHEYISRAFGFHIPGKYWYSQQPQSEETTALNKKSSFEKAHIFKEYDSLGKIIKEIYYSCFSCPNESYEKRYLYDSTGNEVTIVELAKEYVVSKKNNTGNISENEFTKTNTVIHYNIDGTIKSIKSFIGENVLFTFRQFN